MSRTMYSPDGNRPLSPITERTTPGSFRTAIGLPSVDVVDYQSEREDGPPSPDGSLYSRRSTETITPRPAGPIEQSPDPPHNLSKNDVSDAEPIPPLQSTALLGDAVAPGGLPPPPRPIPYSATSVFAGDTDGLVRGEARRRYMARYFPKADGGKGQAEHRGEETKSEGDHGSGIAGIGANGARGGTVRSRPSSFHAGTPGSNAPSPGELVRLACPTVRHAKKLISLGFPSSTPATWRFTSSHLERPGATSRVSQYPLCTRTSRRDLGKLAFWQIFPDQSHLEIASDESTFQYQAETP